jgi:mannan endo-1,4-beta-mannosidase
VDEAGRALPDGSDALLLWVDEMSSFIKGLDPHHLVGVGDEGFFQRSLAFGNSLYNGAMGVDCQRLLNLPAVDFGTCHLYPDSSPAEAAPSFGARWIREHIDAGARATKPMLIEEYGFRIGSSGEPRDSVFKTWLDQIVASQGAGALLWMIAAVDSAGRQYPDYDGYTVYQPDQVPSVLAFARGEQ